MLNTVVSGGSSFTPMAPAPARDNFVFDFTAQIGTSGQIVNAEWACAVSDISSLADSDAADRIVGEPTYSNSQTSALCGDMVEGVIYNLQTVVTLDDGRIFVNDGDVLCSVSPWDQMPPRVIDGVVQFDYSGWVRKFPEFAALDPDQAQGYWTEAGVLFRNDAYSAEQDPAIRQEILDLLTAHLAAMFALPPIGRGGVNALVGVITNKSVNGVSVGNSGLLPGFTGTRAWFATTQYGLKYLAATAGYRSFHYVQGPQRYPYPPNIVWPPYGYMPYGPWPWR